MNNYSADDIEKLQSIECKYVVFGEERGKKENTPHLQGYIEFEKAMVFNTVRKMIGGHIEPRKGTAKQAAEYCKKEENFYERGEPSWERQGARKDLDYVRTNAMESGMRFVSSYYNAQQIRVAEKFLSYNEDPREWETHVTVYFGNSGTGKSRRCREETSEMDVFTKNDGTKWWDGYDGHEVVILDDFRDS